MMEATWGKWFAWRPVFVKTTDDEKLVWLKTIYRKPYSQYVPGGYDDGRFVTRHNYRLNLFDIIISPE